MSDLHEYLRECTEANVRNHGEFEDLDLNAIPDSDDPDEVIRNYAEAMLKWAQEHGEWYKETFGMDEPPDYDVRDFTDMLDIWVEGGFEDWQPPDSNSVSFSDMTPEQQHELDEWEKMFKRSLRTVFSAVKMPEGKPVPGHSVDLQTDTNGNSVAVCECGAASDDEATEDMDDFSVGRWIDGHLWDAAKGHAH